MGFLGVHFWSRDFWVLLEALLGMVWVLVFLPICSSPSLGIRSTPSPLDIQTFIRDHLSEANTPGGGGGTPIHYLYGYVPLNGVVILKLLIWNGVSISEAFSRTEYKKLWITALSSA